MVFMFSLAIVPGIAITGTQSDHLPSGVPLFFDVMTGYQWGRVTLDVITASLTQFLARYPHSYICRRRGNQEGVEVAKAWKGLTSFFGVG